MLERALDAAARTASPCIGVLHIAADQGHVYGASSLEVDNVQRCSASHHVAVGAWPGRVRVVVVVFVLVVRVTANVSIKNVEYALVVFALA